MKKGQKNFLPQKHGLRFVNRFDVADLIDLTVFENWTKTHPIIYGLCGGMCFAALDMFYENAPAPADTTPPNNETPLYKYLLKRQIDSLSLDTLTHVIRWTLAEDGEVAHWTAQETVPELQTALDQGTPVVLALIRVRKGNPTANHQVLAIDYTLDEETGQMEISLYDPNHPGKEPKIFIDLTDHALPPRQSTGEPLRGFFVIRYKKETPPIFDQVTLLKNQI